MGTGSLSDHVNGFLQSLRDTNHQENSIKAYMSRIKKVEEFTNREAGGDVAKVTVKIARRFPAFLLQEKLLCPRSARQHMTAATSFWAWLWAEELVTFNAFREVPLILGPATEFKPQPFREGQLEAFLEAEDEKDYRALWECYAATGARLNEIRKCLHKDLHLGKDRGWIVARLKGGKTRKLTLTIRAVQALREYLGDVEHDPESPVWPRRYKWHWRRKKKQGATVTPEMIRDRRFLHACTIRLRMIEIGKRVGIDQSLLHPHTFRHTFATDLLRMTADLKKVQEALNHARIETTAGYCHPPEEDVSDLVYLRGQKMAAGAS